VTGLQLRRAAPRSSAVALAIALTVLLARVPASGAFAAVTSDGGNSASAASQFCVAPGTVGVTVANDSWVDQAAPTSVNGTTPSLNVQSGVGTNRRAFVRFTMPGRPAGCVLEQAELRLYNSSPTARTIDVLRADPAAPLWDAGSLNWSNQPARVGTAVGTSAPAAPDWQSWIVTDHARALLSGANNGFVLVDRTEGQNGPFAQAYTEQSAGSNLPVLRVTWG
jgi:hypothetical protein